jgi:hypothetical protein
MNLPNDHAIVGPYVQFRVSRSQAFGQNLKQTFSLSIDAAREGLYSQLRHHSLKIASHDKASRDKLRDRSDDDPPYCDEGCDRRIGKHVNSR